MTVVLRCFSIMVFHLCKCSSRQKIVLRRRPLHLPNTSASFLLCCWSLWTAAQYQFTGSISHNDTANLRPEVNVCVSFSSHHGAPRLYRQVLIILCNASLTPPAGVKLPLVSWNSLKRSSIMFLWLQAPFRFPVAHWCASCTLLREHDYWFCNTNDAVACEVSNIQPRTLRRAPLLWSLSSEWELPRCCLDSVRFHGAQ